MFIYPFILRESKHHELAGQFINFVDMALSPQQKTFEDAVPSLRKLHFHHRQIFFGNMKQGNIYILNEVSIIILILNKSHWNQLITLNLILIFHWTFRRIYLHLLLFLKLGTVLFTLLIIFNIVIHIVTFKHFSSIVCTKSENVNWLFEINVREYIERFALTSGKYGFVSYKYISVFFCFRAIYFISLSLYG